MVMHEGHSRPAQVIYQHGADLWEFQTANRRSVGVGMHHLEGSWEAPPRGWFKLNIDGIVDPSSGLCGVGVVVRIHKAS